MRRLQGKAARSSGPSVHKRRSEVLSCPIGVLLGGLQLLRKELTCAKSSAQLFEEGHMCRVAVVLLFDPAHD